MFANTQAGGVDMGGPDTCLTPSGPAVVPIPYPNIAQGNMGVPAAYHILLGGTPTHNLNTTVPLSNGDNSGVGTGVASGTVMGPSSATTGAFTALFGGAPVTRLTSMNKQNSTNCVGARIAPSQTKVLILAG